MDQLVINAAVRTETGKTAAKKLRKNGHLPAVMYNSKGESVMLDIDEAEFTKAWKVATPTTIVELKVDKKSYKAFIKDTEYDIINDENLHVDFHVIDDTTHLKKTLKIKTSGSPVGVREGGVLRTGVSSVTIKCLPKELPASVIADISELKIGSSYKIGNLPFAKGVEILSDKEAIIASVRPAK